LPRRPVYHGATHLDAPVLPPGVVIEPGGCGDSDAITVDGKEQPRLWDPDVLAAAVRQLLHLPTYPASP